ncbi:MAG: cyclic nucleotide-binding domain-containing protein [Thiomicrospira sp.]|nr:cyclic nucleotide-binding domain-containing protein [Thiomicrospira sp.]OIP96524.1 MAG: hypothetical protein AUK56_01630 [Thiomicrospira sp. CG2_30_44_34]NCN66909.1 cyclic nucleotide-binding domain-containing protein [Thiomicrospira sp.]NCO12881.1 cyclic nucleotide-binding domain-containing protein [Thiomicrospira sp.]NCO81163.1 cyclic nucleotide-binding domain-containing protein [Thiomicrospira sp.]
MKSKKQAPLIKPYLPGQVIFKEGTQGDKVYIIKEGSIKITTQSGEKVVTLAVLNKGACFGEMSVISANPRVASATAETATEVYEIDRKQVENIIADLPPLFRVIINSLIKRVTKLNQFVLDKSSTITPVMSMANLMKLLYQALSQKEGSEALDALSEVDNQTVTIGMREIVRYSHDIMGISSSGCHKLLEIFVKFKLVKIDDHTVKFNPASLIQDTRDLINALESTTNTDDLKAELEYIDLIELAEKLHLEPHALLDAIRIGRIGLDAVVLKQSIVRRCMEEQGRQSFY